jgi:hypothetical protein
MLNVILLRLPLPHAVIPSLHLPRHKGVLCYIYKAGREETKTKRVSGGRREELTSSLSEDHGHVRLHHSIRE